MVFWVRVLVRDLALHRRERASTNHKGRWRPERGASLDRRPGGQGYEETREGSRGDKMGWVAVTVPMSVPSLSRVAEGHAHGTEERPPLLTGEGPRHQGDHIQPTKTSPSPS